MVVTSPTGGTFHAPIQPALAWGHRPWVAGRVDRLVAAPAAGPRLTAETEVDLVEIDRLLAQETADLPGLTGATQRRGRGRQARSGSAETTFLGEAPGPEAGSECYVCDGGDICHFWVETSADEPEQPGQRGQPA